MAYSILPQPTVQAQPPAKLLSECIKYKFMKDDILINETTIQVFGATQQTIVCNLYGIQVSVSVVDFFGHPISNANVTLNGPCNRTLSAMTKSDGTATFNNVVGGDMQIVAFRSRRPK